MSLTAGLNDKPGSQMQYRHCGKHSLSLSALGVGCWAFGGGDYWGYQDQKDVDDVVQVAVEHGVDYFDTAEAYNEGRSEIALGKAIRALPRDRLIIGTKVSPSNCYRDTLIEHCDQSLKRLGVDHIDIYMIHWPIHPRSIEHFTSDQAVIDAPPTIEEAVSALSALQSQGKIRSVGLSNFAPERLNSMLDAGLDVVVNELPYSLLTRAIELDILPYCRELGIGVIGYMTLLQGLLTGTYRDLRDVPPWQRRTRHFHHSATELCRHGEEGAEEETNEVLNRIRLVMQEVGATMPSLAIRWALANNAITCALVGARDKRQMLDNIEAARQPLDPETVRELNVATEPLKRKLGVGFDYYENSEHDRTR